jgi:hypothetical protein
VTSEDLSIRGVTASVEPVSADPRVQGHASQSREQNPRRRPPPRDSKTPSMAQESDNGDFQEKDSYNKAPEYGTENYEAAASGDCEKQDCEGQDSETRDSETQKPRDEIPGHRLDSLA